MARIPASSRANSGPTQRIRPAEAPRARRIGRGARTRSYLPAEERKTHLLDVGVAIVREKGWEHLTIVELARRAGVSRQLVHQYFGDLERLALELAERFQDEVYDTAAAAIEHHPSDYGAAMRETLERFVVGLRDERLAYVDLFAGHTDHRRLNPPLRQVNNRKRRRMVEIWARFYRRAYGLEERDAIGLASFQYDGLRGMVAQVDAGRMAAEEAIDLFIEIMSAAIERLARNAE